jgi:hypothetical protein
MYVRPLIASAERSIWSRQRWSIGRDWANQARQKRVVASSRASASSMLCGDASPSAHEIEQ